MTPEAEKISAVVWKQETGITVWSSLCRLTRQLIPGTLTEQGLLRDISWDYRRSSPEENSASAVMTVLHRAFCSQRQQKWQHIPLWRASSFYTALPCRHTAGTMFKEAPAEGVGELLMGLVTWFVVYSHVKKRGPYLCSYSAISFLLELKHEKSPHTPCTHF